MTARPLITLALALAACASTPQPRPPPAPGQDRLAGFAVYLRHTDGRYVTLLLPSPAHGAPGPAQRLDGLWVYDEAADHLGLAGLDACACPDLCGDAIPTYRPAERVHGRLDACAAPPFLSLVGGTLFGVVEEHTDVCATGLNLYSSYGTDFALGPTAYQPPRPDEPATHRYCAGDVFMGAGELDLPSAACAQHLGAWEHDDPEQCSLCTARVDWSSEVPHLRGTHLLVVRDQWNGVGGGPRLLDAFALAATTCPSVADPCGDPRAFTQVPEVEDALSPVAEDELDAAHLEQRFWITTDDRFALVLTSPEAAANGGAWQLWRRGEAEPSSYPPDGSTASKAAAELLGVRFHPHLNALLDRVCAMTCAPTPDGASHPCDDEIGATQTCEPTPEPDESCFGDGPDEPAEPDAKDPRDARALGDACFTAIKAGDLDEAEPLCRLGLARADNDRTRGALHFNLGLIAERRGDRAAARRAYETSLRLRPGNATVQRHLDALR